MQSGFGQNDARGAITNLLIGFFGVLGAFLLLPRTAKFMVRRFFMGIISEVLMVILTGLLTEKLVDFISHDQHESTFAERERVDY